ncbi:MAG: hypothetical protein ACRED8_07535 [Caulobacteraceae bacterium]
MRLILLAAALASVAFVAPPAFAQTDQPSATATSAPATAKEQKQAEKEAKRRAKEEEKLAEAKDPDKTICKTVASEDALAEGGSRLGGQRVCHTRAQWETMSAQEAQAMRAMHNSGFSGN